MGHFLQLAALFLCDGWKVYLSLINLEDRIVSKTYMTTVECENTRLRYYLIHLQTLLMSLLLRYGKKLCYSKLVDMLKYSIQVLLSSLKYREIPIFS